eukprot:7804-Pelagococcus_subviridis.AAC.2
MSRSRANATRCTTRLAEDRPRARDCRVRSRATLVTFPRFSVALALGSNGCRGERNRRFWVGASTVVDP